MLVTEMQTGVTSDHQALFPSTSFPVDGPTSNWLKVRGYKIAEKSFAGLAAEVRVIRDGLLRDTDWMALSDNTLSTGWSTYRQALRDITGQSGFPYNVIWPTKPTE
tara:strand:+ start:38 stop:355 length:318 start_codon:yes stop_codon:yes gene_type:complete